MTALALHCSLISRGVLLRAVDGRLRYLDPAGALTEADRAAMKVHKDALIAILAGCCTECGAWLYLPESLARRVCTSCHTEEG